MKVHLDVPLYLQPKDSSWCVPNGLLGILHFFGVRVGSWTLRRLLGSHFNGGTDVRKVRPVLDKFGLRLSKIEFEYHTMIAALKAGFPIVVAYRFLEDGKPHGHFSCIIGLRKDARGFPFVTLNDPLFGRMEMPLGMLHQLIRDDGDKWVRVIWPK